VLDEIGADDQPRLLAYNKLDLVDEEARRDLLVGNHDAIGISAATGEGLEELRDTVERAFEATLRPIELLVPFSEGARLSELYEIAGEVEREERSDGVLVHARIPIALAHRFSEFAVNGAKPR
jgi:GTP-binding protein HflX